MLLLWRIVKRMKGERAGGIDIGGTKIRWIAMRGGRVIFAQEAATPKPAASFSQLLRTIFLDLHGRGVRRVGVSSAGYIKNGVIVSSANLPKIHNLRISTLAAPGTHVAMRNDAYCFALGEAQYARTPRMSRIFPILALTLGTGIGRALIMDHAAIAQPKRFEFPERWEKDYQRRTAGNAAKLAAFIAPRIAELAAANNARAIVLGGGRLRSPGLFTALRRGIRQAGFHGIIRRSRFRQNSGAIGAALLATHHRTNRFSAL